MLRFSGAGVSDVGTVREHNEDSAFVGPYVALVADGVGGAAAGEVASATAAYVASATALSRFGDDPARVVRDAVAVARDSLRLGVVEDPDRNGMATTLTMLVTDGRRVVLGHVGDSRAYLLRDDDLRQISRDHTYVQVLREEGRLGSEDARTHPWRNVVLRSIQSTFEEPDRYDVDVVELDFRPGDRVLLCSDGLSDFVPEQRLRSVLGLRDPHSAAAVLTQAALEAGGHDNVTCVVVDVVEGPLVVGDGRLVGALLDVANIVDPAAVRSPL
jgi:serine/threonine protein phosphatase PrpC